jgi:hypothetical protein
MAVPEKMKNIHFLLIEMLMLFRLGNTSKTRRGENGSPVPEFIYRLFSSLKQAENAHF